MLAAPAWAQRGDDGHGLITCVIMMENTGYDTLIER
jgi:hypothetical protein